jgi:hypothetical protein
MKNADIRETLKNAKPRTFFGTPLHSSQQGPRYVLVRHESFADHTKRILSLFLSWFGCRLDDQPYKLSLPSTLGLITMAGCESPNCGPFRSGHQYQGIHIHDRAQLGDTYHISEFVLEIPKSAVTA